MELVAVTGVIVGLHACVERVVAPRKMVDPGVAALVGKCWNNVYSAASLLGLLWWLWIVASTRVPLASLLCGRVAPDSALWEVYFWSKLAEGIMDLTTVTLRFPIIAHFRWHHYTTAVFAWLGWQTNASHAFVFMGLNLFMHAMVYAFHGGFNSPLLHRTIRFWQNVQLLGGIGMASIAIVARLAGRPCSPESWLGDVVPPLLFALYFVLFLDELWEAEKEKQKQKQKQNK
jgi:hypothetical protein